VSKLSKFRNSPEAFFADSPRPGLRALARARMWRREALREVLEQPVDRLAEAGPPGVRQLARTQLERGAQRRRAAMARAGEPLVSVVMAARNAGHVVEGALGSLLGQSYGALEVVVVDDASEDDTAAVVERVAAIDARVRLVRHAERRGPGRARNLGIARAKGAYLAFQDADDVSHPERIERQLARLLARPEAVACVCNYRRETPEGRRVVVNGKRFARGAITMVFAREPVLGRLGYLLDIPLGEDGEYTDRMRAFFGDGAVVHLFETLYRARFSPDSLLFSNGETTIGDDLHVEYVHSDRVARQMAEVHARLEAIRAGAEPYVGFDGAPRSARRERGAAAHARAARDRATAGGRSP
jgi:hypothetical protein